MFIAQAADKKTATGGKSATIVAVSMPEQEDFIAQAADKGRLRKRLSGKENLV